MRDKEGWEREGVVWVVKVKDKKRIAVVGGLVPVVKVI